MHIHVRASVISPNSAKFAASLHARNTRLNSSPIADFPLFDIFPNGNDDPSTFMPQPILIPYNHSLANPPMFPTSRQSKHFRSKIQPSEETKKESKDAPKMTIRATNPRRPNMQQNLPFPRLRHRLLHNMKLMRRVRKYRQIGILSRGRRAICQFFEFGRFEDVVGAVDRGVDRWRHYCLGGRCWYRWKSERGW